MTWQVLKVAQLSAAFTTDPAISIKSYISGNWDQPSTFLPVPLAQVYFDTKFAKILDNNIIVRELNKIIDKQTLGASRFRYHHFFKVHILCKGNAAINNRYQIEQHIEDIINANPKDNTDGFDEFFINSFLPIQIENDQLLNQLKIDTKMTTVSRSAATIEAIYDKYTA